MFPSEPFHNTFLHYLTFLHHKLWPNWPTLNQWPSILSIMRSCGPHGPEEAWAGFNHWWWFPYGRQSHNLNLVERKHNELLWSYVLGAWRHSLLLFSMSYLAYQGLLSRAHEATTHSPAAPRQYHKTVQSTSPPNPHQNYLWLHTATPSGISLLLACTEWKTEQSWIYAWKDKRQANKYIHVHKTFNVGNKNCFQSESHDSSCWNQLGKEYQKWILVCDGTSFLKL